MKTPQQCIINRNISLDEVLMGWVASAMEDYADQFKPKWIPVTEVLPENHDVEVLTLRADSTIYAVLTTGHVMWSRVTHWMPLPEKP